MSRWIPDIPSVDEYRSRIHDNDSWLPAFSEICVRHGLDPRSLERQGTGTHIVFRTGERIVKLYAPFWIEDFHAESAALAPLRELPTPELLALGEIDGWPYIVMTLVPGIPAAVVWPRLDSAQRIAIARQLGELMRRLHGHRPVASLATDWRDFLAERIAGAVAFHQVGEPWVGWIAGRLAAFHPSPASPVLLHADITDDHLLLTEMATGWRITGLIDFGDAMMGDPRYEFIAPLAFYAFGEPPVTRALLDGYGLSITDEVREELTTYCLLHKYGRIGVFLARHPVADGDAFRRALWGE